MLLAEQTFVYTLLLFLVYYNSQIVYDSQISGAGNYSKVDLKSLELSGQYVCSLQEMSKFLSATLS